MKRLALLVGIGGAVVYYLKSRSSAEEEPAPVWEPPAEEPPPPGEATAETPVPDAKEPDKDTDESGDDED